MDELKRVFVTLLLLVVTGYVCATETDDPGLLFNHPMFQQLSARLEALEEQSKVQQDRITEIEARDLVQQKQNEILQHRITELETRDLAQQKQNVILQHRITELETRDLAQQKQNEILQHRITELETRDLAQQKQNGIQQEIISDLEAAVRNQQQQIDELNRTLTETNHVCNNLHDVILNTKNDDTTDKGNEDTAEDSTTYDNRKRARRQQQEVDNVAFTVILVHSSNDLGLNQNVVFDKVETNIGNAYNPHHGVFTAPVAGTYVFHVTVLGDLNAETWCKIVVNGVNKADVYARGDANHGDQGSQTLVVQLNQGDDVAIQNGRAHDNVFGNSDLWTTFSGFLLRSDAEVTTIFG